MFIKNQMLIFLNSCTVSNFHLILLAKQHIYKASPDPKHADTQPGYIRSATIRWLCVSVDPKQSRCVQHYPPQTVTLE